MMPLFFARDLFSPSVLLEYSSTNYCIEYASTFVLKHRAPAQKAQKSQLAALASLMDQNPPPF